MCSLLVCLTEAEGCHLQFSELGWFDLVECHNDFLVPSLQVQRNSVSCTAASSRLTTKISIQIETWSHPRASPRSLHGVYTSLVQVSLSLCGKSVFCVAPAPSKSSSGSKHQGDSPLGPPCDSPPPLSPLPRWETTWAGPGSERVGTVIQIIKLWLPISDLKVWTYDNKMDVSKKDRNITKGQCHKIRHALGADRSLTLSTPVNFLSFRLLFLPRDNKSQFNWG